VRGGTETHETGAGGSGGIPGGLPGGLSVPRSRTGRPSQRRTDTAGTALIKSVARSVGTQLGRALVRGLLGSLSRR
jgi:hypothetical protein